MGAIAPEARRPVVPLGEAHEDASIRWHADLELRAALETTVAPDPAGNRVYWQRRLADDRERCYAVVEGGAHLGNCGLRVDAARGKAELWIYLGERRGEGIGTGAVEELLRVAFDELGLRRVSLRALGTNEGALAFWRTLGFLEEGRLREDTVVDGRPVDSVWFGMLRGEWENRAGMGRR